LNIHLCGAGMAFVGFGASLIIGLYAGNPYNAIVLRALTVMFFFYILGCILAAIGHKIVRENFDNEVEGKTPQQEDMPVVMAATEMETATEVATQNEPQPEPLEPVGVT
jgi:hypothetical protein